MVKSVCFADKCTYEYKIRPVNKKIRDLLGYKPRQHIKETVHLWKGISADEIYSVKPSALKWQVAEHPLVDLNLDRSNCIAYIEKEGLGTPPRSSCVGCPFHNDDQWRNIKLHDTNAWIEAIEVDHSIRNLQKFKGNAYLHRSCLPLDQIEFDENQLEYSGFMDECEGMCGV